MKRRGYGAQEWWEGTREEASLTRYSIDSKGWEPDVGPSRTTCGVEPRCLAMYIF